MTLSSASSKIASAITRTHPKDLFSVASKSSAGISTLTPRNVWMHGNDDSSDRDFTRPRVQLTMSPSRQAFEARHYGTSSFDEAPQHYAAGWSAAASQSPRASASASEKRSGWSTSPAPRDSLGEFDPILDIRALNPLIFESNYELEEYGPSFKGKEDDHASLIKEWRIRNENVA